MTGKWEGVEKQQLFENWGKGATIIRYLKIGWRILLNFECVAELSEWGGGGGRGGPLVRPPKSYKLQRGTLLGGANIFQFVF